MQEDPDVERLPEPRRTLVRMLLDLTFEKRSRGNGARANPHEVSSELFPLFGTLGGEFMWKDYRYVLTKNWAVLRFWVPPEKH